MCVPHMVCQSVTHCTCNSKQLRHSFGKVHSSSWLLEYPGPHWSQGHPFIRMAMSNAGWLTSDICHKEVANEHGHCNQHKAFLASALCSLWPGRDWPHLHRCSFHPWRVSSKTLCKDHNCSLYKTCDLMPLSPDECFSWVIAGTKNVWRQTWTPPTHS